MSQNIQRELELALDSGNSYEALQLLKSLLFRSKNGHDQSSVNLFLRAIKSFIDKDNASCAFDLCKAFVESLSRRKENQQINRFTVEAIINSVNYMKKFPNERSEYIKMLLKWANEVHPVMCDDAKTPLDLHKLLGEQFLSENDTSQAFYHFVRSDDAQACAGCVLKMQNTLGYPSEFDLFAAQAILQLLVLKHVEMAEDVFQIIRTADEQTKAGTSRSSVMFNFLDLLIKTCKKQPRNVKNFELLVKGYARVYGWDPVLEEYVRMVGQHMFGTSVDNSSSNILAEAMRNLLNPLPEANQSDYNRNEP